MVTITEITMDANFTKFPAAEITIMEINFGGKISISMENTAGNYVPLVTRYVTLTTSNVIYSTCGKETLQGLHRIPSK